MPGPFSSQVCFEILKFGGEELQGTSQKPVASRSEMHPAACLPPS